MLRRSCSPTDRATLSPFPAIDRQKCSVAGIGVATFRGRPTIGRWYAIHCREVRLTRGATATEPQSPAAFGVIAARSQGFADSVQGAVAFDLVVALVAVADLAAGAGNTCRYV